MATPSSTAADVLVIFGITGDLAKQMTVRSLYRLERRRMLGCPIVGVARDEWSAATLRDHARRAIEDTVEMIDEQVFQRFAERLSMVSAISGTRRPMTASRGRSRGGAALSLIWRSRRRCSVAWLRAWPAPT
jgi:glucose-6-phosphate 1-dehydrogenase